MKTEHS